jgi:hypothetical protein
MRPLVAKEGFPPENWEEIRAFSPITRRKLNLQAT